MQQYTKFYRRNFPVLLPFGKHRRLVPGQLKAPAAAMQSMPKTHTSNLSSVFGIPVVYAEEGPPTATVEIEKKAPTTLEVFEKRRPKTVVSDPEIKQYLEKETGWDRLRDMYSLT